MFDHLPYNLQRLRLRSLRQDDLSAFHAYRCDAEVARLQGWSPMTAADASGFLESQVQHACLVPGAWHQLGIASVENDLLIGDAGIWLSPDCAQAEFGLSITPAAQGNGYGTECARGLIGLLFSATPVAEIVASTDARNAACLTILARSGMRQIDTRQVDYKGEICTEQVFSVGRTES
ncbi:MULTISPECIES: GNAT family N-acetyltransferase [unclassified Lysobacter]